MNELEKEEYFNHLHNLIDIKDDIRNNQISFEEGDGRIKKGIIELSDILYSHDYTINNTKIPGRELFSYHFIKSQFESIIDYFLFGHNMEVDEFVNFFGNELLKNIETPHEYIFITRMGNFPISKEYVCKYLRIISNTEENVNSLISEFSILSDKSDWLKKKLNANKNDYRAIIVIKSKAISGLGFFYNNDKGERTGPSFHDNTLFYDYPYLIDFATTALKKFKCICNFIDEQPIFFDGINFSVSPSHFLMEIPSPMFISYSRDTLGIFVNPDLLVHYQKRHKPVFDAIEELVKKGNARSSYENKKLQAIYWLGEAIEESELHSILIKNIVALETLFLNDDENDSNKGAEIAKRASMISCTDRALMRHIKRTIPKAYQIRNDVMHRGSITIKNPSLIYDLINCSRYVFNHILTNSSLVNFEDMMNLVKINKDYMNSSK